MMTPPKSEVKTANHPVKRLRIAVYQRYSGGNIDEGWTRLVLEQFAFACTSLFDPEIRKGTLNEKYDVIVIPEDSTATITGDRPTAPAGGGRGGEGGGRGDTAPPEYRAGIGAEGVAALRTFVEKGGALVTLGGASNFAIERFGLALRNAVANKPPKEFFCPGSTLRTSFVTTHPIAYGMPEEGLALFLGGSVAFELGAADFSERYEVVARYGERDLLQSGWLIGEQNLAKHPAAVVARIGAGQVVLLGFRVQHRAQAHGTYKLLFNSLVTAPAAGR